MYFLSFFRLLFISASVDWLFGTWGNSEGKTRATEAKHETTKLNSRHLLPSHAKLLTLPEYPVDSLMQRKKKKTWHSSLSCGSFSYSRAVAETGRADSLTEGLLSPLCQDCPWSKCTGSCFAWPANSNSTAHMTEFNQMDEATCDINIPISS